MSNAVFTGQRQRRDRTRPIAAAASRSHGDPTAIGELVAASFRDHAAAIRGKAMQMTRDPEVAADATQEAFLRLFVEMQAGRVPDNVTAWLYRTTANLIISRARHTAVAGRMAPRLVRRDRPAEPDEIVVLREERDELHVALGTMSTSDRTALMMAAHGATGLEIASRLGRSHPATRTLLSRARGRLRIAAAERGLRAYTASTALESAAVA